jgi:heme/copper-type cytochrome/quinol oxidase subunit 3
MSVIPADVAPSVPPRRRQLLFGTSFAAAGCAIFLLTLLGSYLEARHGAGGQWLSQNTIPLTQPTMQLFTLLMSSFTVQWVVYAIARDNRTHAYLAAAITLVLGLAMINQTWFLYTQVGLPITSQEGPLFYAVTGGHLAMLGAAILFLGLNTLRALGGAMSSRYPDGLSAAALFWHVTVALYGAIWLGVYVLK